MNDWYADSADGGNRLVGPIPEQVASAADLNNDNVVHNDNNAEPHTTVDGQGMWRSWTRVFAKAENACLDLLDNCFDAALATTASASTIRPGRVLLESRSFVGRQNGIVIRNNSQMPVKNLEDVLTVYKSSKNAHTQEQTQQQLLPTHKKDAIGENGVGLKHGCATLSDTSLVITRNHTRVQMGVIAKKLQSSQGVYLPHFTFDVTFRHNTTAPNKESIAAPLQNWLTENPRILKALDGALLGSPQDDNDSVGEGTLHLVTDQLTQLVQSMWENQWQCEEHVFVLVLCQLKKTTTVDLIPNHALIHSNKNEAKTFLQDIHSLLPEYYINLPVSSKALQTTDDVNNKNLLEFTIDGEPVQFQYWQRRLVEMTKFELYIPVQELVENLPEETWNTPEATTNCEKYKLSVYCGLDAQRVNHDMNHGQGTSTCYLYIYSCQAGRLIQKEKDARHLLGLNTSGVDYTQGLTVIINDTAGKLPLTPTKDGIAWSEHQPHGDKHCRNLMAWAGAAAHFYWTHQRNQFLPSKTVKETMRKSIRSFAQDQNEAEAENGCAVAATGRSLEDAQFSHFVDVKWRRVPPINGSLLWKIRKATIPKYVRGPDTLWTISKQRISCIRDGRSVKRKASNSDVGGDSIDATTRMKRRPVEWDGQIRPWPEIDPKDIPTVTVGILSYFRGLDREGLFERPVVEQLPELANVYREVVSTPMDFQTIEGERVHSYTSIQGLQNDLVLVFQNCIQFNGANTEYGQTARQMLACLEDAMATMSIPQMARRVLSYFRQKDYSELFERPVAETLPDIQVHYCRVISNPMDFSTIEESRIDSYTSLAELRQDLTLTFKNCILFNGADSDVGKFAQEMLASLDEAFESAIVGKTYRRRRKVVKYDGHDDDDEEAKTSSRKASSSKGDDQPKRKKLTYPAVLRNLRQTETLLQIERNTVQKLRQELAACKRHVRELEDERGQSADVKRKRRKKKQRQTESDTPMPVSDYDHGTSRDCRPDVIVSSTTTTTTTAAVGARLPLENGCNDEIGDKEHRLVYGGGHSGQRPKYVRGTKVRKDFGHYGWFDGKITTVDNYNQSYHITYSDGDIEHIFFESPEIDLIVRNATKARNRLNQDMVMAQAQPPRLSLETENSLTSAIHVKEEPLENSTIQNPGASSPGKKRGRPRKV